MTTRLEGARTPDPGLVDELESPFLGAEMLRSEDARVGEEAQLTLLARESPFQVGFTYEQPLHDDDAPDDEGSPDAEDESLFSEELSGEQLQLEAVRLEYESPFEQLKPAERKALFITSLFETGRPGGFHGLTGSFDKMGISFGLMNWNIGSGSLQPLLRDFARDFPERFKRAFGKDADRFLAVLDKDKAAQLRFAIDEMNSVVTVAGKKKYSVKQPWVDHFQRLSQDPEFQRMQVRYARQALARARCFCDYFSVKSERAFAFMFDAVTSHGKYWLTKKWNGVETRRNLLRDLLQQLEARYGKGKIPEADKLSAIAKAISQAATWTRAATRT